MKVGGCANFLRSFEDHESNITTGCSMMKIGTHGQCFAQFFCRSFYGHPRSSGILRLKVLQVGFHESRWVWSLL